MFKVYSLINYIGIVTFILLFLTLLLGIFVRLGSLAAMIFFFLTWLSWTPLFFFVTPGVTFTNPLTDVHFIQMIIMIFFFITNSGFWLGLGEWWLKIIGDRWYLQ